MRSGGSYNVSSEQVHRWALNWLIECKLLKDHGWLCTASVVWSIVLRASARMISIAAACRDLANAPSDQAVFNALGDGLPKTLKVLERRINEALTGRLSRRIRRRRLEIAIDWHLEPYYGEPHRSKNELYWGVPRLGTTKFHAYATACIVEYGQRYTLALTWVRRHESMVTVLRRLIDRIHEIDGKIGLLLLDRAFFNTAVIEFLQEQELPFLMPVMFRGRQPKGRPARGLHAIRRQNVGWYKYTMKNRWRTGPTFSVCVVYRTHKNPKNGKRVNKKLLFAAWKPCGAPTAVRERYRLRFGIETSYRQMRQARIYTCTRDPHLRLVFIAVAFILRNLWVWIHETYLAEGSGPTQTLRLELLRFKRLLDWIAQRVVSLLHDGSTLYVAADP